MSFWEWRRIEFSWKYERSGIKEKYDQFAMCIDNPIPEATLKKKCTFKYSINSADLRVHFLFMFTTFHGLWINIHYANQVQDENKNKKGQING